jgi:DDE superfamily endonuclease
MAPLLKIKLYIATHFPRRDHLCIFVALNNHHNPACTVSLDQKCHSIKHFRMYIDKQRQKTKKGVKAMKSKDRITMMVCISCKGKKEPLALIGKAKKPKCFQLCPNETPPLPYKGQSNAWFDKTVMMWWIWNVFWPFHLNENGDVPTILLLDNFSGQTNLDKSSLP